MLSVERVTCLACGREFVRLHIDGQVYSEETTMEEPFCSAPACEEAYNHNLGGYLERAAHEAWEAEQKWAE